MTVEDKQKQLTEALPKKEFEAELHQLLTWWSHSMVDEENGGFFGRIDGHGKLYALAPKGIILNTRILWGFSAAANQCGEEKYTALAKRAYHYLKDHFFDPEHGGVFWEVNSLGKPCNEQKQVYAQVFAIYALTEYYQLIGEKSVLQEAEAIFYLLEKHSRDRTLGGYRNVFEPNWTPAENQRLSDKDEDQGKIMNTHLHVMEAYANLYRVAPEPAVAEALKNSILLILDKFCSRSPRHLYLYFSDDWKPTSREKSFGHDIECAWLLREAAHILGEEDLMERVNKIARELAGATLQNGRTPHGMVYEKQDGKTGELEQELHWWPQAEAVVGFLDAYQHTGEENFLQASALAWNGIKAHFRDGEHGEWHWLIDEAGNPLPSHEDKAGPWKAPYHNVRMCLEVLRRMEEA